jgi:hypothetical protein
MTSLKRFLRSLRSVGMTNEGKQDGLRFWIFDPFDKPAGTWAGKPHRTKLSLGLDGQFAL